MPGLSVSEAWQIKEVGFFVQFQISHMRSKNLYFFPCETHADDCRN